MKKLGLLFVTTLGLAANVHAALTMECEYRFDTSKPLTKLSFSLPDEVKFGKLVPLQILPFGGSVSTMNTVILKDYPYLMLADVYRIESEKSKTFLMKISPDKTKIELAFVNMGEQANAKFFKGTCSTGKDMK